MHLTTTNHVSGVWRQNSRAGVIPAISFTRLSRRNARISAHAMPMRAYVRIFAHGMRMRAYARIFAHGMRMRAYARISRMRCECSHMRAFPRMRCDAMRCECAHAMRCECAHHGGTYACPVLYSLPSHLVYINPRGIYGSNAVFIAMHLNFLYRSHQDIYFNGIRKRPC